MKSKLMIYLVVALALVATQAQETNAPGPRGPRAGNRPLPPRGGARFADAIPALAVLTDEQRTSAEQALSAQREKLRELEMKVREARQEMWITGMSGKFDEATVRKQAQAVASLEAEMAVVRVRALSQIQPPLSAEQIEKIKSTPGPRAGAARPLERPQSQRSRILQNQNRDENNLPPKQ